MDACNSKDQTISYCGVGAYHQNGIVERKNRILTQGARTLLLHGIRMWPQMIDQMFWPFAIKAMAERLNTLHLNTNGQTPESILYNIPIEDIPVKNVSYSILSSLHARSSFTACWWSMPT